MSAPKHVAATVRELMRYIQREHPDLDTSFDARLDQLLVTGTPGRTEPPATLREILGSDPLEVQDEQVTGRSRWVVVEPSSR